HCLGALDGQGLPVLLSVQLAFGSHPCKLAGGSCALTQQLAMGTLEECCIAGGVVTHVLLPAALGTAGLQDEDVGCEQRFDRGEIAVGQGSVEPFRHSDGGFRSGWNVDVRGCRSRGVRLCMRLCRLRHCGGYDGQCQRQRQREGGCYCVHTWTPGNQWWSVRPRGRLQNQACFGWRGSSILVLVRTRSGRRPRPGCRRYPRTERGGGP